VLSPLTARAAAPWAAAAVYTHERCSEHWLRFLEIAEHYGSAEEAAAADAEAGRKPREQPAPGVPEPERNEAPRLKNPMPQMPDAREHGLKDERRWQSMLRLWGARRRRRLSESRECLCEFLNKLLRASAR